MFTTPFFHPGAAAAVASDFAPLFRLLDTATAELVPGASSASRHAARRSFNPRFDVREVDNNYELQGEVPGIQQQDLQIEFVDERTLVIRGRTEREKSEGNVDNAKATATANAVEGQPQTDNAVAAADDAASEKSSNFHKASVEDEYVDAGAEAGQPQTEQPTEKTAETADAVAEPAKKDAADNAFKYWVSERSIGEFERRFAFPGRVDQEAVTASLKNGILSVVVPKIVEKQARRIEIQ